MTELKDSGERIEFGSGMVRDTQTGKPRFDLFIPEGVPFSEQMLTRVALHLSAGAEKYAERNWEKGNTAEERDRAKASAFRHFLQWMTGETDEDHAAAAIINILFAETIGYKMRTAEIDWETVNFTVVNHGRRARRVFVEGDPEPPADVTVLEDNDGDRWYRRTDAGYGSWTMTPSSATGGSNWRDLLGYAPLTEVHDG